MLRIFTSIVESWIQIDIISFIWIEKSRYKYYKKQTY